jgi:DNA-binding transcriptional LysR family regulator
MLDTRKLRHIVALAEAGSYARAAEILNISQPALSQSIQAVELSFGIQLFDRSRRGVTLTSSGRRIVADAQILLRDAETLERNMKLLGAAQLGEINFGLDPLCAGIFLVELLAFLGQHHVGLKVQAMVHAATELERQLLNHELELAVIPGQLVSSPAHVEQLPLLTVRVALLVRPGHTLLEQDSVSLDDLAPYPFIAGSMPKQLQRMEIDHPLWRAATIRCDDYGLMGDVAAASDAIWMASAALAKRAGEKPALVELPMDRTIPMPQTDIVIASLKGLSSSPAAAIVREKLMELSTTLK